MYQVMGPEAVTSGSLWRVLYKTVCNLLCDLGESGEVSLILFVLSPVFLTLRTQGSVSSRD
jgi:hypothetical protein